MLPLVYVLDNKNSLCAKCSCAALFDEQVSGPLHVHVLFIYFFAYVNICRFLETDRYQWYGFDVIRDIVRNVQWESSGYFPRVSICDFEVCFLCQVDFLVQKFI